MTTRITVDAHAGWPVKVISVNSKNGDRLDDGQIVPPKEVRDFYIWDGRDLIIHEVQPSEVEAK